MKTLSLLLLAASLLRADGGKPQWRSRAGPYEVSVFTAPVPLRAGPADISVLVELETDKSLVLDADVSMRFQDISVSATHALATNKIMYAANVSLSSPGTWDCELVVRGPKGTGSAHGAIEVIPAEQPLRHYWPYFAMVPAGILLFILNQRLKARQRRV